MSIKGLVLFMSITAIDLLFPLWFGLTRTDTDPGFRGHFYFHYLFFQFFYFLVSFYGLWTVHARGAAGGSSSVDHKSSDPSTRDQKKGQFPSFSVQELSEAKVEV